MLNEQTLKSLWSYFPTVFCINKSSQYNAVLNVLNIFGGVKTILIIIRQWCNLICPYPFLFVKSSVVCHMYVKLLYDTDVQASVTFFPNYF